MNLFKQLSTEIHGVIATLQEQGVLPRELDLSKIDVAPPRDPSHGDIAVNAAMVLAAQAGKKPREIAEAMLPLLFDLEMVEHAEIAGPGFVNLRLNPSVFQKLLAEIIAAGLEYGDSDVGQRERVNIEYVSANPTGPMHVGHARGAVVGDAMARLLLKAGYAVAKEYYINDAGAQVDKLADSAYLRYREALGENIGEIPEGLYPGEYLMPVGKALAEKFGKDLKEKSPELRAFVLDAMMALIRDDLAQLGIHHEVFSSEKALADAGKVEEAVALLEKNGLIYTGVLEPPKGKVIEDWEPRPQTLFKSTQFGDDCDRPIKKSDGSWTYFAPDIALHYDKIQRGFTTLIDIFGADHGGYVKRISAAVAALSGNKVKIEVKLCQLVKFMRRGEPLKMSKRAGTFVTVREVVDEVGKDVLRFMMLTRKNDMPLDFDFEKVTEQSKENPVFYVHYAHARCKSVLRHMQAEAPEALALAGKPTPELLARLSSRDELQLIKKMADFPRIVEGAAESFEPHRIAFYLQELAAEFHSLWNKGTSENTLRFIVKDDIKLSAARAVLAQALAITIASGLDVLGVTAAEELRA